MNRLTDELRQELQAHRGVPVPVVDDQTQRVYYIITSEQFERVRTLFMDEEFSPRELYPLTGKTAGEAGWNDPAMDAYDHYDDHRAKV
jgi:hypothetical protein